MISGVFRGIERQERLDRENAALIARRERWNLEVQRAIRAGFSERVAPFAVSARLTRGPVSVGVLRAHLEVTHPELFEEAVA